MKKLTRISEGELEIMQAVWHGETPITRGTIEQEIAKHRTLATTTILTFLARLCEKGYLSIERRGKTNYYTPLVEEREYLACESKILLKKLYGGSMMTLATSLSDAGISHKELEELRQMLDEDKI